LPFQVFDGEVDDEVCESVSSLNGLERLQFDIESSIITNNECIIKTITLDSHFSKDILYNFIGINISSSGSITDFII